MQNSVVLKLLLIFFFLRPRGFYSQWWTARFLSISFEIPAFNLDDAKFGIVCATNFAEFLAYLLLRPVATDAKLSTKRASVNLFLLRVAVDDLSK